MTTTSDHVPVACVPKALAPPSTAIAEDEGCGGRLFFPKKIPTATFNMLVGEWVCGGQSFYTWWGGGSRAGTSGSRPTPTWFVCTSFRESTSSTPAFGPPSSHTSKRDC